MVRRRFVSLAAIVAATAATAGCENPDTPIERSEVCRAMDAIDDGAREYIQLATGLFEAQERYTRQGIFDNGMALEEAREATSFILDEDGNRIPLGTASTLAVLPQGRTQIVEVPLFAAYNYTEASLGLKADGTPSFGIVAAPATDFRMVQHEAFDGQTQTRVTFDEQRLSNEQFESLPANLQALGLTIHAVEGEEVSTSAGPRPLYELRNRTALLATRYNDEAERLSGVYDAQRDRYRTTARWCDEEAAKIRQQQSRLQRRGGAAVVRTPQ